MRILCRKVNADFLQHTRSSIQIELTKTPVTMTYAMALANFRNEVNQKFPPEMAPANRRTRRINQTGRGRGREGRGRGRGRGSGRGRGGRGHPEARYVTGSDGKTYEVHASYKFDSNVWSNLPQSERNRIMEERRVYRESKKRSASQISTDDGTAISEMTTDRTTTGGTVMGGRNEQASLRSRPPS